MITLGVRFLDVLAVAFGAWLAHVLSFDNQPAWLDIETILTAFDCALALLLFPAFNVYQSWRGKPFMELVWRITGAWLVAAVVGLLLVFSLHRSAELSRLWFGMATLLSGISVILVKVVLYAALRQMRQHGLNQKRVVIVAGDSLSRALLNRIRCAPQVGFQPVCIFEPTADQANAASLTGAHAASQALARRCDGVPVLSDFRELTQLVRAQRIDEIWLALPLSEQHTLLQFIREFRDDFVNLRFMPDTRSISLFNHSVVEVLGMPAINLAASPVAEPELWPKLVFDRLFAAGVLMLMLPLFIAIAIAVKLSSPGPVLFSQRRKGIDGHEFKIYKFRTMRVHTEAVGKVTQARRHDPRITPVGAFLRRTSLDELPQFINVLLGQMSVVGPRPHALEHDNLYKDQVVGYMFRYRIKPGITGWAQINGYRGETTKVEKMEARVKFDLFYIQNWSFWFDIKIVLLTLMKGFVGRNAY